MHAIKALWWLVIQGTVKEFLSVKVDDFPGENIYDNWFIESFLSNFKWKQAFRPYSYNTHENWNLGSHILGVFRSQTSKDRMKQCVGTWSHCCIEGWARRRSWWLRAENWSWIWLGACKKTVVRNTLNTKSPKGRVKEGSHLPWWMYPWEEAGSLGRTLWWEGWRCRWGPCVATQPGGGKAGGKIVVRCFSQLFSKVTCRCRLCLITTCWGAGGERECGESTGEWSWQSEGEVVRARIIKRWNVTGKKRQTGLVILCSPLKSEIHVR